MVSEIMYGKSEYRAHNLEMMVAHFASKCPAQCPRPRCTIQYCYTLGFFAHKYHEKRPCRVRLRCTASKKLLNPSTMGKR